MNQQGNPLIEEENLFELPGPPLSDSRTHVWTPATAPDVALSETGDGGGEPPDPELLSHFETLFEKVLADRAHLSRVEIVAALAAATAQYVHAYTAFLEKNELTVGGAST